MDVNRLSWINFYGEFAKKLLKFKSNREELVKIVFGMDSKYISYFRDYKNDEGKAYSYVDPFSVFGIFNRSMTDENRIQICSYFKDKFGMVCDVPSDFDSVPVLNPQKSVFVFREYIGKGVKDVFWNLYELILSESFDRERFCELFDKIIQYKGVRWNITMALYWIRPYDFMPLDKNSREYLANSLGLDVFGVKDLSGKNYLKLIDTVKYEIDNQKIIENSIPEISYRAWKNNNETEKTHKNMESQNCNINKFTTLLKSTRNLILTGAPGTGKTYLAKEIAAAMGCTENEIGFVQFHPSYDYTDFVEGLRPVSKDNCDNIGFERKDGVFKEFCKKALKANFYNDSNNTDNFEESWEKMIGYLNENNFLEISLLSGKGNFRVELNEYGNGLANRTYKDDVYSEGDWIKGKSKFFSKNQLYNIYKGLSGVPAGGHDNYRKAIINHMESDFGLLKYRESKISSVSSKPFVFIIDEINRGEISKIFGELFFSIDPGYRGEKGRVKTQYQNLVEEGDMFSDGFFVPENVYIIGTMNDIDRSVESMDFAFRRRFAFVEVKAEDNVKMLDELEVLDLKDDAINRMNRLNSAISKIEGLSSAYHIGASYFLKLKEYGDDCREALWNYHLEGLLREYLRGMPNADEEMRKLENAYLGNESNTNNG
ncbi:MAG: AAA family ATPase [Paludibacteraceae bacterium]|nr:AAA family ATPase [Paludibacteraceae bacterium]